MKNRKSVMLYIGGNKSAYRCHCGANVFHIVPKKLLINHMWRGRKVYECNGCGDWYSDAE